MHIYIHGKEETVPDGLTVTELMHVRGVPLMVAVELNGSVLERRRCHTTRLEEHDRIEFLDILGGG